MYSLDFAAQVSRICMDEIRRRGKNVKNLSNGDHEIITITITTHN